MKHSFTSFNSSFNATPRVIRPVLRRTIPNTFSPYLLLMVLDALLTGIFSPGYWRVRRIGRAFVKRAYPGRRVLFGLLNIVPVAAAFEYRVFGHYLVALNPYTVDAMTDEEIEWVIAHEIAHFEVGAKGPPPFPASFQKKAVELFCDQSATLLTSPSAGLSVMHFIEKNFTRQPAVSDHPSYALRRTYINRAALANYYTPVPIDELTTDVERLQNAELEAFFGELSSAFSEPSNVPA